MNEWLEGSLGSFILPTDTSYVSDPRIGTVIAEMIPQGVQGPMKETSSLPVLLELVCSQKAELIL